MGLGSNPCDFPRFKMGVVQAVILESVARMAYYTIGINPDAKPLAHQLHDQHYLRKHGKNAYYGQAKDKP